MKIQFKKRLQKPWKGLKKLENYYTWGRLVEYIDGNWYADAGSKSLVKIPKTFFHDVDITPSLGKKIPIYISRYSDSKGLSRVDQERIIYYLNFFKMKRYHKDQTCFEGEVHQVKVSGYVVKFLPYNISGETRYFYGFMPNSYSYTQSPLNIEDKVQVQIKYLDIDRHSVILSMDSSQIDKSFDTLSIGQKIDGKIISLRKYGAIVLVGGFHAFLPFQDFYFDHREMDPSKLRLNQVIENLMIFKKNIETKKIYLTAKHIYDSLENYFNIDEEVDCKVTEAKGYGYLLQIKKFDDIHFKGYLNFKHSDWRNTKYIKHLTIGQNVRARILKMSDLKIYLTLRIPDNNFWLKDKEELQANSPIRLAERYAEHSGNIINWDDSKKRVIWVLKISHKWTQMAYKYASRDSKDIPCVIYKHLVSRGQIKVKVCKWLTIIELMRYMHLHKRRVLTLISYKDNWISFVLPNNPLILRAYLSTIDNLNLKINNDYRFRVKYLSLVKDKVDIELLSNDDQGQSSSMGRVLDL